MIRCAESVLGTLCQFDIAVMLMSDAVFSLVSKFFKEFVAIFEAVIDE